MAFLHPGRARLTNSSNSATNSPTLQKITRFRFMTLASPLSNAATVLVDSDSTEACLGCPTLHDRRGTGTKQRRLAFNGCWEELNDYQRNREPARAHRR